jgi:flagellar basal-body rod modification protein FlgD
VSTTTGINGAAATDTSAQASTAKKSNELGQDAFLQLLTTQLANQDPLSPMDNSEYIAQLAQFSSLEQLTSVNASMQQLVQLNSALLVAVTGTGTNTDADTSTGDTTGGN